MAPSHVTPHSGVSWTQASCCLTSSMTTQAWAMVPATDGPCRSLRRRVGRTDLLPSPRPLRRFVEQDAEDIQRLDGAGGVAHAVGFNGFFPDLRRVAEVLLAGLRHQLFAQLVEHLGPELLAFFQRGGPSADRLVDDFVEG